MTMLAFVFLMFTGAFADGYYAGGMENGLEMQNLQNDVGEIGNLKKNYDQIQASVAKPNNLNLQNVLANQYMQSPELSVGYRQFQGTGQYIERNVGARPNYKMQHPQYAVQQPQHAVHDIPPRQNLQNYVGNPNYRIQQPVYDDGVPVPIDDDDDSSDESQVGSGHRRRRYFYRRRRYYYRRRRARFQISKGNEAEFQVGRYGNAQRIVPYAARVEEQQIGRYGNRQRIVPYAARVEEQQKSQIAGVRG